MSNQDKRSLTPIEAAQLKHKLAAQAFEELQQLKDHLNNVRNEAEGVIRIDFRNIVAKPEFLPLHPKIIIDGYMVRLQKRIHELENRLSKFYGAKKNV